MNTCTFVGGLPRDAELRAVGENKVCNFSIGSNVGFGDNKKTLWIECGVWGKRGEALNDNLKRGQQVVVSGELQTKEYQDKEGQTKTTLYLNIQSLAFGSAPKNENAAPNTDDPLDDEIPF